MELNVDRERCQGHGKCYLSAPGLFQPDEDDDWGRAAVLRPAIDDSETELVQQARQAVTLCPEFAIELAGH